MLGRFSVKSFLAYIQYSALKNIFCLQYSQTCLLWFLSHLKSAIKGIIRDEIRRGLDDDEWKLKKENPSL
jgi:hypothetical protein